MDDPAGGRGDGPRQRRVKLLLVGFGLCSVASLTLGYKMHPESKMIHTPPPPAKVEVREVEVRKEVRVPTLTEDCKQAIDLSVALSAAVDRYEGHLGEHQDVISDSQSAVSLKDYKALVEVDTRLRAVKSKTLADLLDIRDTMEKLADARSRCLKRFK